jgi:hypothetical protein
MSKRTSKKPRKKRKIRTRDHVIADLSFHHVTGPILRAGFTIEVPRVDYGIDAHVETFTAEGLAENGTIFLQLKATDNISSYRVENGDLSFPMDTRDLDYWAKEHFPAYQIPRAHAIMSSSDLARCPVVQFRSARPQPSAHQSDSPMR